MNFWKKKTLEPLKSDEYEELTKKVVAVVGDIDRMSNSIALLDGIVKSNRARINKIKVEEIEKEGEKSLNNEPKYI